MQEKITILSFDCGLKNLAWARLTVHRDHLRAAVESTSMEGLHRALRSVFELKTGLENVIGDRKVADVDEMERTRLLNARLKTIPGADYVLVERQPAMIGMGPAMAKNNTMANAVAAQIAYHYTNLGCDTYYISPALKTSISMDGTKFKPEGGSAEKYKARKKNSIIVYKQFLRIFALGPAVHGKSDDIADAVLQALAFLRRERLLDYMTPRP